MISSYGLYAYGIVDKRSELPALLGIDTRHKLYPVEYGNICLMVSQADIDDFRGQVQRLVSSLTTTLNDALNNGAETILQAHADVVNALMQYATIVPFKFGTLLKDEAAASQLLHDSQEEFLRLLSAFTGKAEWGLKVYADPQAFLKQDGEVESTFKELEAKQAALSKGAAYLFGKTIEARLKADAATQLARVSEAIFQALGAEAADLKTNEALSRNLTGHRKEMILNAAFLVARANVARFRERGDQLQAHYAATGLDLEVSGPWPPYSFM